MPKDSYSIKEHIDHAMQDVREKIDDIREDVKVIKEQTIKTNGRVNELEKSKIQMWTAIIVIIFCGSAIITLSVYAIKAMIKESVRSALEESVDKVEYAE